MYGSILKNFNKVVKNDLPQQQCSSLHPRYKEAYMNVILTCPSYEYVICSYFSYVQQKSYRRLEVL